MTCACTMLSPDVVGVEPSAITQPCYIRGICSGLKFLDSNRLKLV